MWDVALESGPIYAIGEHISGMQTLVGENLILYWLVSPDYLVEATDTELLVGTTIFATVFVLTLGYGTPWVTALGATMGGGTVANVAAASTLGFVEYTLSTALNYIIIAGLEPDRVTCGGVLWHDDQTRVGCPTLGGAVFSAVGGAGGELLGRGLGAAGRALLPRIGRALGLMDNVVDDAGRMAAANRQLRLPRTNPSLAGTNTLGETAANGEVFLRPGLTRAEQLATLRHEGVHAYLSVADDALFARFRQDFGIGTYNNSDFFNAAEEILAEGIGSQLQTGLATRL